MAHRAVAVCANRINMKQKKDNRGFTIIELVFTIVIISLSLIGVMTLFENATRGALQADLNYIAVKLAHEKLEWVVMDKVRIGYATLNQTLYPNETFTGSFSPYTRSTTVAEVSGADMVTATPGSGYKRIEVTVSWGAGASKRITVPTILADY